MKLHLRPLILAAALAAVSHLSASDRWSTDETAVRMGVNAWFSVWARPTTAAGDREVKNLYATEPSAQSPALVQKASLAASLPSAMSKSRLVAVTVHGDRAVTTFLLRPNGPATNEGQATAPSQVVLTWERRSGRWRIVQEAITPVSETGERVALTESIRK
jgi:hypothetical protein